MTALLGEDVNSVRSQLTQLAIDIATFTLVVQRVSYGPAGHANRLRNPLLREFIARGFATMASTALRRQVDDYELSDPAKGVSSLASILEDMKAKQASLTRSNLLRAEGLPYEYEGAKRSFLEACGRMGTGARVQDWQRSEIRHETIDKLTGRGPSARSADDPLDLETLCCALEVLRDECACACTVVNKYIAHSATESSRAHGNAGDALLTLETIRSAHELCCRITTFLAVDVLGASCGGYMPVFAYDHLEHLDLLVGQPPDIGTLRNSWEACGLRLKTLEPWRPPVRRETSRE